MGIESHDREPSDARAVGVESADAHSSREIPQIETRATKTEANKVYKAERWGRIEARSDPNPTEYVAMGYLRYLFQTLQTHRQALTDAGKPSSAPSRPTVLRSMQFEGVANVP